MLSIDKEIVLMCAMRYALGRKTYVVGSVCFELKNNYNKLLVVVRKTISNEIQKYQDEHGKAGMDFDNEEWNKVKWLFDKSNEVKIKIKEPKYKSTKYIEVIAIKGQNGKYYSIPKMYEYHNVIEIE
jgi:hypothetical protein